MYGADVRGGGQAGWDVGSWRQVLRRCDGPVLCRSSLTALTAQQQQQLPADCSRHRRIHDIAHVEIAAPLVIIHLPLSFERPLKYICPEKEGVGSVLNVIAVYWAGQMMLIFVMDVNLGLSRQKIFS